MAKSQPYPSGLGERRAAAGLYQQYQVQAALTYRALASGLLDEVRIADPAAMQVDDFQVLTPESLDAYQVKWSSYPGAFTFIDLINSSSQEHPLIAQLAEGWRRLREDNPRRRVIVHLLTNDHPSRDDKPGTPTPSRLPRHFAAFLREVWIPWSQGLSFEVAQHWVDARCRLIQASGLDEIEFEDFIRSCQLDVSFRLPSTEETGPTTEQREARERGNDLEALQNLFFKIVADPSRIVALPRRDLLRQLGWDQRFELRHRHEFPDPEIPYRPIEASVHALERALSDLTGGYILLLGSPGSGKSTLLTKVLRDRYERVVLYYAFVRDDVANQSRGEASSFLHDLTLELERQGIGNRERLPTSDPAILAVRLHVHFQQLHREWVETGRKTLILVDGLDHIAREQVPSRTLLRDLPERVPDGVFFLLGSQTDLLSELPPAVKRQIKQPERILRLQPLSREAVFEILSGAALSPVPAPVEIEEIFRLSAGHPLALSYIVNRLRQSSGEAVARILAAVQPFSETIADQYLAHWQQVADDFDLVHLLALLVRIRGALDLDWVRGWAQSKALYRLVREFAHYFRQEPGERWYFFHNSFRVFLLQQTRGPALGSEEDLFRELAVASTAQPLSSSSNWGEIFYLLKAGEISRAMALVTVERFREQFYHGRPWSSIRDDLKSLLPLTVSSRDSAKLARLLFCGIEIGERSFNAEEYADLPRLLLQLREWRPVLAWLDQEVPTEDKVFWARETTRLLGFVQELAKVGHREEAKRLFERTEPLALLAGRQKIHHADDRDTQDLLTAWVEVAYEFRPIPEILERIANLHHEESQYDRYDTAQADRDLQNRLRFHLARCMASAERWPELTGILAVWDPAQKDDRRYWFWSYLRSSETAFHKGELTKARDLLAPLTSELEPWPEEINERIFLADAIFQIQGDHNAVAALLENVKMCPLSERSESHVSPEEMELRFRYYRLLRACGELSESREIIPDASRPEDQDLTYFERALYLVAKLWGSAWRNPALPPDQFQHHAEDILRSMSRKPTARDHSWYQVEGHRAWLCRRLIQATRFCIDSAMDSLFDTFAVEWSRSGLEKIWPPELQREIILEFGQESRFKEKATEWLNHNEVSALRLANVVDRLENLKGVFRAWLVLGDMQRARGTLSRLMKHSLGVHLKDPQTRSWIAWLQRVNKIESVGADQRLAFLAVALPDLRNKEVLWRTSPALIEAAWAWQPTAAQKLFTWLLDKGLIGFCDGLFILMKRGAEERSAAQIVCLLFEEVLLPAERHDRSETVKEITRALLVRNKSDADCIATGFLRAVLGRSLLSQRRQLLKSLREAFDEEGLGLTWQAAMENFTEELSQVGADSSTDPHEDDAQQRTSREEESFGVKGLNQEARHLLARGDREGAWTVALAALEEPTESRWRWWQDREGFVETLSILREIDPPRSREIAFQSFVEELCHSETGHFILLGSEFHRVAPLLSDPVPDREIWTSIEPYLNALFPNPPEVELPQLGFEPSLDFASARALVRLVLHWLEHPVYEIAWGAQRIITRLLFARSEPLTLELPAALSIYCEKTPTSWGLLICLEAVSLKEPLALSAIVDSLLEIADSVDFLARQIARHILESLNTSTQPPRPRELPEIYRLVLPEREEALYPKIIEPHEDLPPTDVPAEMVKGFRPELDLIARKAGVGRENLYTRVTQLAQEAAGTDCLEKDAALRLNLELVGLKIPFRRPRTRRVRWAVSLATAELVDAACLSRESAPHLEDLLKNGDPSMLLIQPEFRPACITPIAERLEGRDFTARRIRDDWTQSGTLSPSAIRAALASQKQWIYLAEETCLRWLEWEEAEETRTGVLLPTTLPPSDFEASRDPLSEACIDTGHLLARDYDNLDADPSFPIVLRNGFKFETPGRRFLALNPTVGRSLGWSLASQGLFRWENASGELMVESLWWQDGWMGHKAPAPKDEVGEGWLVRASIVAWEQLRAYYPILVGHLLVRRRANDQTEGQVSSRQLVGASKDDCDSPLGK